MRERAVFIELRRENCELRRTEGYVSILAESWGNGKREFEGQRRGDGGWAIGLQNLQLLQLNLNLLPQLTIKNRCWCIEFQ